MQGTLITRLFLVFAAAIVAAANPLFVENCFAADPKWEAADVSALERVFVELAGAVRPTVVAIRTYRSPADVKDPIAGRIALSQGSGFIMDREGFIGTNRHVIDDADSITVRLSNGEVYEASVVGSDRRSDLAVLKITAVDLAAVSWGELSAVRVNQFAFACGNPFGMANQDGKASITFGVVSALGRQMTRRLVGDSDIEYYGNLIETSAPINPGNSGGPLFNIHGEIIGVVTAIETSSGLSEGHGFAIPIDKNTRRILATLQSGQEVRYGFLGIEVQEVDAAMPHVVATRQAPGALVREIRVTDGPAALAGLKPRDIVLEFDGIPIENSDHLVRIVGFTPVGTEAEVTFLRNGVKRKTTVRLGDRSWLLELARSDVR